MPSLRFAVLACLFVLSYAPHAQAKLGDDVASIDADRRHMKASLRVRAGAGFTVHELTLGDGTLTREYVSAGTVFAVSWNGPMRPDLQQLFGDYFNRFQADNQPRVRARLRRPLAADHPDFIVRSGGHSGASWGYAVLPGEMPANFDMSVLMRGAQ